MNFMIFSRTRNLHYWFFVLIGFFVSFAFIYHVYAMGAPAQITICHDEGGILMQKILPVTALSGHSGHINDIIPPFDGDGNVYDSPQNWNTGEETWNNGCQAVVVVSTTQCSDGIDNDHDDAIDFPEDIGCSSLDDDNEADDPTGSIRILKVTNEPSAEGESFSFDGNLGHFSLDTNGINDGIGDSFTATQLVSGNYTVTEDTISGWTLADISCDGEASVTLESRSVTVALADAQQTQCTFTNNKGQSNGGGDGNSTTTSQNGPFNESGRSVCIDCGEDLILSASTGSDDIVELCQETTFVLPSQISVTEGDAGSGLAFFYIKHYGNDITCLYQGDGDSEAMGTQWDWVGCYKDYNGDVPPTQDNYVDVQPGDLLSTVFVGLSVESPVGDVAGSVLLDNNNNICGDDEISTYDFGDAPASYGTLWNDNGARHVPSGNYLGTVPDVDSDGNPNFGAFGDDNTGEDDEDGITNFKNLVPGLLSYFVVNPHDDMTGRINYLNGWIDFNHDGDFDDVNEQIVTGFPIGHLASVRFLVPDNSLLGKTFARFRYSTIENLGPIGKALDGEVEDKLIEIRADGPRDVCIDCDETLALTATTTYNEGEINQQVDAVQLCREYTFAIPESITRSSGDPGDHYAQLLFHHYWHDITCLYQGDGDSEAMGTQWDWVGCYKDYNGDVPPTQDNYVDVQPGVVLSTNYVELRVDGDQDSGPIAGFVNLVIPIDQHQFCENPQPQCFVEGYKYNENGEPLSGWTIGATHSLDAKDPITMTTDDNGYYCLPVSSFGDALGDTIYVFEEQQNGWTSVDATVEGTSTPVILGDNPFDAYVAVTETGNLHINFTNRHTQCSDGLDNDGDSLIDSADPGCHSDGDASNVETYDASDTNELNSTTTNSTTNTGSSGRRRSTGGGSVLGVATTTGEVLGASCTKLLNEYLFYGSPNNPSEVQKLKIFLDVYLNAGLDFMNGVFDLDTQNAVKQLQVQNAEIILKPWVEQYPKLGDDPSGDVYITTRAWINNLLCPDSEEIPSTLTLHT